MNAMEWIQTLLISGLCIPSFCADYRQHCIIETPKSWSDAQSYCRERGSDLATIDDMGAMKSLLALNADKAHDELWIGLRYGSPGEWHWSLQDEDFYQEGERNYRNPYFPEEGVGGFALQINGMWNYNSRLNRFRFVCYDGNRQGGDRYVFVQKVFTWAEAQEYCRSHHTDLVSIRNSTEDQAVAELIGTFYAWIGLFKDPWYWSDGRSSSFRLWDQPAIEEKLPFCTVMTSHTSGRWSQRACNELHPFLCTCKRKRVLKVKVRSEDIQELNDPALITALLKQTQKLLNKVPLSDHHKMMWKTNSDGQVFTKEQRQEEEGND